jgi:hypothetical protein
LGSKSFTRYVGRVVVPHNSRGRICAKKPSKTEDLSAAPAAADIFSLYGVVGSNPTRSTSTLQAKFRFGSIVIYFALHLSRKLSANCQQHFISARRFIFPLLDSAKGDELKTSNAIKNAYQRLVYISVNHSKLINCTVLRESKANLHESLIKIDVPICQSRTAVHHACTTFGPA